ncbi:MAG: hypothetical protein A2664_02990 [Candidatus Taylorbacteria bacterium RIFCSPHIGHO2_01_FULL_46_22b]|uniref:SIR2-like domain-containing protein n=1 Tax=Candidatus Taylorbacteria bacterium RIFCSPHIGHO2_01_FULL_46_22b TaxID=1802301 RepID=A0A1G2M640_9BACT|nr:MAG: hypothetical protein A2664_02990 [Candidatus Taylorbacteria bacterium RIFCSPHIGHO2_01_FULL_46_22b]
MAYPLIILGAGASYDYSPIAKVGPLTKDLVEDHFLLHTLLGKYPGAGDLLSDILLQVKEKKRGFEEVLTEIKERTKHSEQMRVHFVALEFYLQALFKEISNRGLSPLSEEDFQKARQVNNYKSLVNRINTHTSGKALVATFNYDSLFEQSIPHRTFKRMRDYLEGGLKIIKLHGSHDWAYIHRKSNIEYGTSPEEIDGFSWCIKNPDFLEEHRKKDVGLYHQDELKEHSERNDFIELPAIAIPLLGKDRYICHPEHIQRLLIDLPQVDRILVIGWKAGDQLLLQNLKKLLPSMGYKLLVVSSTIESAERIAKHIKDSLEMFPTRIEMRGGGFSGFIADEISDSFFSE